MKHRLRTLAPAGRWRHPAFARLWVAHTVLKVGSSVTALALPLLAVLTLQATPLEVGLLTAVGTLPLLIVGLFAGVWIDRRPRRPVMVAADLGRAALLPLIPLAAWFGLLRIKLLYAVALLTGLLTVFFDVASQSFVTTILDRTELVEGNSKLHTSYALADVAGPGLAGGLVRILTAPGAILVDAASFVISALLLRQIETVERAPERPTREQGVWREIGEGLQAVAGEPNRRTDPANARGQHRALESLGERPDRRPGVVAGPQAAPQRGSDRPRLRDWRHRFRPRHALPGAGRSPLRVGPRDRRRRHRGSSRWAPDRGGGWPGAGRRGAGLSWRDLPSPTTTSTSSVCDRR